MDEAGVLHLRWKLLFKLDTTIRGEALAALTLERPALFRLGGATKITLYPTGQPQKHVIPLCLRRADARELADRLLPIETPTLHTPAGSERAALVLLGANGISTLALVALDNADALRAGYGPVVMSQLVCFVANQWKKHFDRPAERVVCRLADSLFVIGCADKNCKELEEELHTLYGQMPHECVASVGLMKMVPIPQSIAVACTSEVRGRNWEAVFQLCRQRLEAVQQAGGDQVSQS